MVGQNWTPIDTNRRFRRLIVEVGQQLELYDRTTDSSIRDPAPDRGGFGCEVGAAERLFEPCGVHRPTGDLEADMYVHIDRTCVMKLACGAKQIRDHPSEHDEFRPFSIVVDDAH